MPGLWPAQVALADLPFRTWMPTTCVWGATCVGTFLVLSGPAQPRNREKSQNKHPALFRNDCICMLRCLRQSRKHSALPLIRPVVPACLQINTCTSVVLRSQAPCCEADRASRSRDLIDLIAGWNKSTPTSQSKTRAAHTLKLPNLLACAHLPSQPGAPSRKAAEAW